MSRTSDRPAASILPEMTLESAFMASYDDSREYVKYSSISACIRAGWMCRPAACQMCSYMSALRRSTRPPQHDDLFAQLFSGRCGKPGPEQVDAAYLIPQRMCDVC